MNTVDSILRWYNGVILVLLVLGGAEVEHRWLLAAGHLAVFLLLPRLARTVGGRGFTRRALWTRVGLALLFLPLAFSETGLLLPWINPTPYEWHAYAADLALGGGRDFWAWTSPLRTGVLPDLLILCYATFYFLPLALFLRQERRGELGAARETLVAVTFGFAMSYLLYLVFPVLWPVLCLDLDPGAEGGGVLRTLLAGLDGLELNKRDCFPSGHTWLTLTVLHLAWQRERKLAWVLTPVATGLVLATVVLRFHFLVDVLAGAALYLPSLHLSRWLDREGGAWAGRGPDRPRAALSTGST